jgi:hypothetical protein
VPVIALAGTRIDELAVTHERTRAGIEARLVKRGRLEADRGTRRAQPLSRCSARDTIAGW